MQLTTASKVRNAKSGNLSRSIKCIMIKGTKLTTTMCTATGRPPSHERASPARGGGEQLLFQESAGFVSPEDGGRSLQCVGTIKFMEGIEWPSSTFSALGGIFYVQGQRTHSGGLRGKTKLV